MIKIIRVAKYYRMKGGMRGDSRGKIGGEERFLTVGRGHWGFHIHGFVVWFPHGRREMIQGDKERRQGSNSPESPVN